MSGQPPETSVTRRSVNLLLFGGVPVLLLSIFWLFWKDSSSCLRFRFENETGIVLPAKTKVAAYYVDSKQDSLINTYWLVLDGERSELVAFARRIGLNELPSGWGEPNLDPPTPITSLWYTREPEVIRPHVVFMKAGLGRWSRVIFRYKDNRMWCLFST